MTNQIHATAIIGDLVALGAGNKIGPYAVILGEVSIGDDNWIGPFAAIGTPGEIHSLEHGAVWEGGTAGTPIRIGSRNIIREFITVQAGDADETRIGDDCYLMNKTHVAHDCNVGDGVTMSVGSILGGHTQVGAGANIGLNAVTHQRMIVGPGAMVGMGSIVTRVVPPHAKAFGSPARVKGVNRVGMQRNGFDAAAIDYLESVYAADDLPAAADVPAALRGDFAWWQRATAAANKH